MAATRRIPEDKYPILDHTINSMFWDEKSLRSIISRSMALGYVRIGQIIQMTEDDFFGQTHAKEEGRQIIIQAFKAVDLEFGMVAPGWAPPEAPVRAHAFSQHGRRQLGRDP